MPPLKDGTLTLIIIMYTLLWSGQTEVMEMMVSPATLIQFPRPGILTDTLFPYKD